MKRQMFVFVGVMMVVSLCACQPAKRAGDPAAVSSLEASSTESTVWVKIVQRIDFPPSSSVEVDAGAAAFVAAIKSKDLVGLRDYYPADYPAGELKANAPDLIFARSTLLPLVNHQAIATRFIDIRPDGTFGILFYQKSVANRINDKAYLKSGAYLKTFFVCRFSPGVNGQWQVAHPILCYDETEGPYEDIGSY